MDRKKEANYPIKYLNFPSEISWEAPLGSQLEFPIVSPWAD